MITKSELLKKLAEEGIKISERMLTYFISLGLIKKPVRFGLGQGKGSVSEFNDKVIDEIKEIVELHKEGLTYEQIKQRKMSFDDWLYLVRQIRESSKSNEDVTNFIKKIPSLSDREKGRLKLISDVAEHLTKVIIGELELFLGEYPYKSDEDLIYDVHIHTEGCLPNVFCDYGLTDEDYEEYLNKGKVWRLGKSFSWSNRSYRMWKNKKPAKGGKHGNHDKK